MTREFAVYKDPARNHKPGMFRNWVAVSRFVGGLLMSALVFLAAGVGIWVWGSRVFSLVRNAPAPIQFGTASVLLALFCLTLGYRRFRGFESWSHWALGVLFFCGIAVQNFLMNGGGF